MQKQQENLFEVLIDNSSEEFQILDSVQILKEEPQSSILIAPTLSIKLNGVYVVIPHQEAEIQYTSQEQWTQLLSKKLSQRKALISVIGLNSIIGIDRSRSKKNWDLVVSELGPEDEYICNDEAQFSNKAIKEVQKNVQKMFKRLGMKKNSETQYLKSLIIHVITLYQLRQPHLGNLKGLQYICYGIYRCFHKKTAPELYNSFAYLMVVQDFRQVFYNSNQLFYVQLEKLCEQLSTEAPRLFKYLTEAHADWAKIFISYYKGLLLYGIQSEIVASKIFDLVSIYGIQILRIILVRIISRRQDQLIKMSEPEQLMSILGTSLIWHEFEPDCERKRKDRDDQKGDKRQKKGEMKEESGEESGEGEEKEKEMKVKLKKIIIGI